MDAEVASRKLSDRIKAFQSKLGIHKDVKTIRVSKDGTLAAIIYFNPTKNVITISVANKDVYTEVITGDQTPVISNINNDKKLYTFTG